MSRLLARMHREEMLDWQAKAVAKALREAGVDAPRHKVTAGGDPLSLRGLPAIGPGVSGAIRGTDPARQRHISTSGAVGTERASQGLGGPDVR